MGSYCEYVLPAAEHWTFRPGKDQMSRIIHVLRDNGWLRPESECDPEGLAYVHPSQVQPLLDAHGPAGCLNIFLEGGASHEWPEDQVELTADVCEEIRLVDSVDPLIVPSGDLDLELPCPSCSTDILAKLRSSRPEWEGDEQTHPYAWLAAEGYDRFPGVCPECGIALSPPQMAIVSDGERIDDVPVFHFCLALSSNPSETTTSADPGLLTALQRVTGVAFRSTGRWG